MCVLDENEFSDYCPVAYTMPYANIICPQTQYYGTSV